MLNKLKIFFEKSAEDALADIVAPLTRIHNKLSAHIEKMDIGIDTHNKTIDVLLDAVEAEEAAIVNKMKAIASAQKIQENMKGLVA